MEVGGIVEYLKDKSILVTGSTGFLAKIFVEKLLRAQPDVKKLFLLVRAPDAMTAMQRLQGEVIGKELFRVLREKHGKEFHSFISERVSPIAGDIACKDLGIEDSGLKEDLQKEIDIVVNIAATTDFDERYDVAFGTNVLGAKHVLEFSKKCTKLLMFLHVSTAYVAGEREGLILEQPFHMGETIKGGMNLDIETELRLVEERKKQLHVEESMKENERIAMKELGLERARLFGWPNTYVFTKAMGEMVLGQLRENLPLVIVRPTIITSTYKEPLPGWMEGFRTIDSVIIGYARGKLGCFIGDFELTMDVIPGDMVVNAMIVSMIAHSNQRSQFIYHIGSSRRNPVKYSVLVHCVYRYFAENPLIGVDGKVINTPRIPVFRTMASFHRYMVLRHKLPLEGLRLVNIVFCCWFSQLYNELSRKYRLVMRLVNLYKPYTFFKGCFDDMNSERLRIAMAKGCVEAMAFDFDPRYIDWDDYFSNIHIPGVLKYVLK